MNENKLVEIEKLINEKRIEASMWTAQYWHGGGRYPGGLQAGFDPVFTKAGAPFLIMGVCFAKIVALLALVS